MKRYISAEGRILYRSLIKQSMNDAGYDPTKSDPRAVLIWYDSLRRIDFFSALKPWQIVNRFPNANVVCRKAPFIRLLQRTSVIFPSVLDFIPKSFIIPLEQNEFEEEVKKGESRFIIKPDRGSLGEGIKIVNIGEEIPTIERLSVAQKYITSYTIDGYKFDFRIYALLASVDPLRIYVYRNGVARFCSKKIDEHSLFSELTNKSLNKKNPEADISKIVKCVSDVMIHLEKAGCNTNSLWQKIDQAIVTTIITASEFLKKGMEEMCPKNGFQKCFQILGFDVMLDQKFNPYVLEVNYRPSLETNTTYERAMKAKMLSDAMSIIAPSYELQKYVIDNYSDSLESNWSYLLENDALLRRAINATNEQEYSEKGDYVLAFPVKKPRLMRQWERMMLFVAKMPTELKSRYYLPPNIRKLPSVQNPTDSNISSTSKCMRLEILEDRTPKSRLFEKAPIKDGPEEQPVKEETKMQDHITVVPISVQKTDDTSALRNLPKNGARKRLEKSPSDIKDPISKEEFPTVINDKKIDPPPLHHGKKSDDPLKSDPPPLIIDNQLPMLTKKVHRRMKQKKSI